MAQGDAHVDPLQVGDEAVRPEGEQDELSAVRNVLVLEAGPGVRSLVLGEPREEGGLQRGDGRALLRAVAEEAEVAVVGAIVGMLVLWLQRKHRDHPIPFGPFLAMAGWLALLWGDTLTGAYLRYAGMQP